MTTVAKDRELHAPSITPENEAFFAGAAQGALMIKQCAACNRFHFYPRAHCPFCFSDRTEWVRAGGRGRIYTFSVLRLGTPTPFALAYVELDEGPRMMTNIVDCDLDTLEIGQAVRVVFKAASNGTMIPMFTPAVAR